MIRALVGQAGRGTGTAGDRKPALHVVPPATVGADGQGTNSQRGREARLRSLFTRRLKAVERLRTIDADLAVEARAYAKDEGLAFVRIERLRREFSR